MTAPTPPPFVLQPDAFTTDPSINYSVCFGVMLVLLVIVTVSWYVDHVRHVRIFSRYLAVASAAELRAMLKDEYDRPLPHLNPRPRAAKGRDVADTSRTGDN